VGTRVNPERVSAEAATPSGFESEHTRGSATAQIRSVDRFRALSLNFATLPRAPLFIPRCPALLVFFPTEKGAPPRDNGNSAEPSSAHVVISRNQEDPMNLERHHATRRLVAAAAVCPPTT